MNSLSIRLWTGLNPILKFFVTAPILWNPPPAFNLYVSYTNMICTSARNQLLKFIYVGAHILG
jgi:hypothetical protein